MSKSKYLCEVSIYLQGTDLDPAHVSAVLGVNPSKSQCKGENKITSTNRQYSTKVGLWAVVVDRKSNDVPGLVEELESLLGTGPYAFADIQGVQDAYVDVFLAMDSDDDGGGTAEFCITPKNVDALARFGIPVRFTIAVVKA